MKNVSIFGCFFWRLCVCVLESTIRKKIFDICDYSHVCEILWKCETAKENVWNTLSECQSTFGIDLTKWRIMEAKRRNRSEKNKTLNELNVTERKRVFFFIRIGRLVSSNAHSIWRQMMNVIEVWEKWTCREDCRIAAAEKIDQLFQSEHFTLFRVYWMHNIVERANAIFSGLNLYFVLSVNERRFHVIHSESKANRTKLKHIAILSTLTNAFLTIDDFFALIVSGFETIQVSKM